MERRSRPPGRFDEFWFEAVELIDAGEDTVVAVERFGGRARLSGVETDQTSGWC